jgi:SNF family Na+-dependent transporter
VFITYAANFILIYRGVSKGIETFCKYAMPVMILCAVVVLIRVMTLSGQERTVIEGLASMWEPKLEKLTVFGTWIAAAGQIFFSLSVGFGVIINYASYMRRNDDVVLSGLTACSVNEFFEVCLGGMITLPAAFIFLGSAAASMGTFGLGFNALPNVFALMPAGQLVGFLWFLMLFLAAITSSLSMLQPVIAFLEEGFALSRRASTLVLATITLIGSWFVLYYSAKSTALDTLDFWIGNVLIVILALIQAVLYAWIFGIEFGEKEAHQGAHMRIPRFVQYMLKFVTPLFLLVILGGFFYSEGGTRWEAICNQPVAMRSVLLIGVIAVSLAIAVHFAGKRWVAEGRLAD